MTDRPGGELVARLNLRSLEQDASLELDDAAASKAAAALTADGESIWVANYRDSVIRIDFTPG